MASGNVMAPVYIFRNRRGEAQTGHERLPGALFNNRSEPLFRIGRLKARMQRAKSGIHEKRRRWRDLCSNIRE